MAKRTGLAAKQLRALDRLKTVRGIERFYLAGGMSLPKICRAFVALFGKAESDLYHVLRAHTYFDDAEADRALPECRAPRPPSHRFHLGSITLYGVLLNLGSTDGQPLHPIHEPRHPRA